MAVTYTTAVKNARMNAVTTAIGTTGVLEIGTTGMGTVLATIPLANPAAPGASGELTQVESLQRELAKLEAAQRSRELWAERNQDVQAATAELSDILRDDEDVAGALVAMHEHETRLMLGVLGITMK